MNLTRSFNGMFTDSAAGAIAKCILVKQTSSGIDVCGAGGSPVGVTVDTVAAAGEAVAVQCNGISICKAGGTVTVGANVKSDSAGCVVDHTNGTDDYKIVGVALDAATSGGYLRVKLV